MSHPVIIVNRRAGAGAAQVDALTQQLSARLRGHGAAPTLLGFGTAGPDARDWPESLERALAAGGDRVFVLGGDGTVLAVAAELIAKPVPLAIIPLGTANLLARDLGIPLQPERAVDVLAAPSEAAVRAIDVGRVNGHLFLCASMIGLTTRLARTREAARGRGLLRTSIRLMRKTLWLLRRYPYRRVWLRVDGRSLKVKTRALVITNNPIGPVMRPYPRRDRLDTGQLGVYGVHQGPLHELPRLALRLLRGRWRDDPRFFHYQAGALHLSTRPERKLTVMNDGERLRIRTPLHYDLLPGALQVLAPCQGGGPNSGGSDDDPEQAAGERAPRPRSSGFGSLLTGGGQ
jgi:diacylglycerol kinase family enzyme